MRFIVDFSLLPLPNPLLAAAVDSMILKAHEGDGIRCETLDQIPRQETVDHSKRADRKDVVSQSQSDSCFQDTDVRQHVKQNKQPPSCSDEGEDLEDSLPLADVLRRLKRKQSSVADGEEAPTKRQRLDSTSQETPSCSKRSEISSNARPSTSSKPSRRPLKSSISRAKPRRSTPKAVQKSGDSPSKSQTLAPAESSNPSTSNSIAKPKKAKKTSWVRSEYIAMEEELRWLRADERERGIHRLKGLRDVRLWSYIAKRLAARGIVRTAYACKNHWNRNGRADSGFEERAVPTDQKVTSRQ